MPILVDGDNLLGTWGRARTDAERRSLAHELARWARRERKRLVTVFDGEPPPQSDVGVGAVFSGRGKSADDVILERLRGESDPRGWLVVTSDKSLGDQCRWIGARVERSDRFRHRLQSATDDGKPEREEDVDYWLEQFGGDEEAAD